MRIEFKSYPESRLCSIGGTRIEVQGALEDAEDYKAFEAAIIADYDAQSAVERELVLRLASALWRLRRATAIETGLFEIEADRPSDAHLSGARTILQLQPPSRDVVYALFRSDRSDGVRHDSIAAALMGIIDQTAAKKKAA